MFNKDINFSTEFQYSVSLKKQQFITWAETSQNDPKPADGKN